MSGFRRFGWIDSRAEAGCWCNTARACGAACLRLSTGSSRAVHVRLLLVLLEY